MEQPLHILERYFGYRAFRPGQEEVVRQLLSLREGGAPC